MARIDQRDFSLLQEFVDVYSLRKGAQSPGFVAFLKSMHRRHLMLMLVSAQVGHLDVLEKDGLPGACLNDVVSDLTEAFFCVMNGAYKAAYTLLRSAIETYLRAVGRSEFPEILTITSVYQLFDCAEDLPYFRTDAGSVCFKTLKASYGGLCKYVHSSMRSSHSSVSALSVFPTFEKSSADRFKGYFEKVLVSMVDALVNAHPKIYLEMHFTGQDLLSDLLPRRTMRAVHGSSEVG
ncbi:hypothetical protein [Stenotrophomonas bentonitica]|uniref:hypothetical protein n=1 Tax=Stenotrophomonas bentonitica TaxID=1450134 RepID=UPI00345F03EB